MVYGRMADVCLYDDVCMYVGMYVCMSDGYRWVMAVVRMADVCMCV